MLAQLAVQLVVLLVDSAWTGSSEQKGGGVSVVYYQTKLTLIDISETQYTAVFDMLPELVFLHSNFSNFLKLKMHILLL